MTRSRPITFLTGAAVIPLVALSVAACGGGGSAATAATPKTSSGASGTVDVSKSSLGEILVNSNGRTLYLFKADTGMQSECADACATKWPPLLAVGKPRAGAGLTASKLGTITRSEGTQQVTYNGHPLYLFVKDQEAGDANGQGVIAFGAAWFAVSPSGSQISARSRAIRHSNMRGRCSMNKLKQKRLVDGLIEAYVNWREACLRVGDAYGCWASGTGLGAKSAFASYTAALDHEERAAEVYAALVRRTPVHGTRGQ